MPVLPVGGALAARERRCDRKSARRPRSGATHRDDAEERRPTHGTADLDRRAPHRQLRRSVRPRPPGRSRPTLESDFMTDAQPQQPQQAQPGTFQIEKIYVKDLSLEIPHSPKIFLEQVQPQLEVQINTSAENFAEGYYEVTVTATVTATVGERTLFLAEARQAGIFQLRLTQPQELGPLLGIACPTLIYPYLRETLSDMISRGGFPPVILAPLNFEALYLQQQQNAAPAQLGPRYEVARN